MIISTQSQRGAMRLSREHLPWSSKGLITRWLSCDGDGENSGGFPPSRTKEAGVSEITERNYRNQQALYSIKSTQPGRHPAMVMVVEREREVERVRGGCFSCTNGKVAASFSGSDDRPGLAIDTTAQKQVMKLAPDPGLSNSAQPPLSRDSTRSALPSLATEPLQSNLPSQASKSPPSDAIEPASKPPPQASPTQAATSSVASKPARERSKSEFVTKKPRAQARPRVASHM